MAEPQRIPTVNLGSQGLVVSKLGLGCMGLTGTYNDPLPEDQGISIIKHAFNKGITFFDTADVYGANANELLLAKALKQLPREKIQIATKFGVLKLDFGNLHVKGTPDYVRSCCEASLKRLDVDYIDLYYQHRVDTSLPIEQTYRNLGIGIVSYSPLGRGFFGGKGVVETLPSVSSLSAHPRYQAENIEKNKWIYKRIESLAKKYECTTPQLALAWVLQQGNDVVPIPGTTKIKNLDENIGALWVKFTEKELREISEAIPVDDIAGIQHYNEGHGKLSWKFANTPPKDSSVYEL
ncbi:probable aldo-keto reductase 1 isoform X2 [Arachis stenosperma]|uniref:probable aldo-keto reductase 1 isoform X2 n=1 Tax=Arachis stenosperma TaxID=217475 RepID=UPI0025AC8C58|nr:probable aldo-keto reductase 1 isoform X2 [Arachis stenosperma]